MYNAFEEDQSYGYAEMLTDVKNESSGQYRYGTKSEKKKVSVKPTVVFKEEDEKSETDKVNTGCSASLFGNLKSLSFPDNNNQIDFMAILQCAEKTPQSYVQMAKRAIMICSAGRGRLASVYDAEMFINRVIENGSLNSMVKHNLDKAHNMMTKSLESNDKILKYPVLPGSFIRPIRMLYESQEETLSKVYMNVNVEHKEISYICYRITSKVMQSIEEGHNEYSHVSQNYIMEFAKDSFEYYTGKSLYTDKVCKIMKILKELKLIEVAVEPIRDRCSGYKLGENNQYKYYDIHGWIDQVVSARKSV